MNDQQQLLVRMALDTWNERLTGTNTLIEKLTDEQLMQHVAPGRNRGIYLMGHLIVVHDMMLPLLRFQEMIAPELKPIFLDEADSSSRADMPSREQLRAHWKNVHDALNGHMGKLSASEWFTRHASVSEEDFAKEPHRNRLNVLLGRTNHMSYHRGQLALLPNKA